MVCDLCWCLREIGFTSAGGGVQTNGESWLLQRPVRYGAWSRAVLYATYRKLAQCRRLRVSKSAALCRRRKDGLRSNRATVLGNSPRPSSSTRSLSLSAVGGSLRRRSNSLDRRPVESVAYENSEQGVDFGFLSRNSGCQPQPGRASQPGTSFVQLPLSLTANHDMPRHSPPFLAGN